MLKFDIKWDFFPGEILISVYALAALLLAYELQRTSLLPLSLIYLVGEMLVIWGALQQLDRRKDKKEQGR